MVDTEFKEILTQKATIKKKSGVSYGQPIWEEIGTEVDIYWERKNRVIKNKEGREVTSSGLGMLLPDVDVEVEDKIVDPLGNEWEVLDVQSTPDIDNLRAVHHKEVFV